MAAHTPRTSDRPGGAILWCEARPENIRRLEDFVLEHARARGLAPAQANRLSLVLEELLCNICRHAYPPPGGKATAPAGGDGGMGIRVEPRLPDDGGAMRFTVIDLGRAFDPTRHPVPDTGQSLSERRPGGLGIHLVRHTAAGLSYARVRSAGQDGLPAGERNELTVVFSLASQTLPPHAARPEGG